VPITYSYEPSDNFALTRVTGSVFDSDPVDHLKSVLAHPSYRPGISALVICQDVDLRRFSTQGIQRLVSFTREVERELWGCDGCNRRATEHGLFARSDIPAPEEAAV
jgi:hypothetical protein